MKTSRCRICSSQCCSDLVSRRNRSATARAVLIWPEIKPTAELAKRDSPSEQFGDWGVLSDRCVFARVGLHPPWGGAKARNEPSGRGGGSSFGASTTLPGNSLTLVSDSPGDGRVKSLHCSHPSWFSDGHPPDPQRRRTPNAAGELSCEAQLSVTTFWTFMRELSPFCPHPHRYGQIRVLSSPANS